MNAPTDTVHDPPLKILAKAEIHVMKEEAERETYLNNQ